MKDFDQASDISTQLSVVNEIMPLTGAFFSGTDFYTKNYINIVSGSAVSGGFFETVYDGAPTSLSSSALIDLTYGHSSASLNYAYSETFLNNEKTRVYQLMAQLLLGNKNSLFTFNSVEYHELFFLSLKRRVYKDEIKKGDLTITTRVGDGTLVLSDAGAASSYTNGVAGEEAALFSGSTQVGRVYYNAGIVVVGSGAFAPNAGSVPVWSGSDTLDITAISGTIDSTVDGLRDHLVDNGVRFLNQTNLHSTYYFCRALNNEFNYSSNDSFIDTDGRILPTSGSDNQTRTYITKVGLYDINNNLLAVASTSEPVKKSPDTEVTIRVRLAY